jgi:hypothetical protein
LFSQEKIYMPMPQKMGRGDEMGRGPYEKSGIINDTGLPPGKTVESIFNPAFENASWIFEKGCKHQPPAL